MLNTIEEYKSEEVANERQKKKTQLKPDHIYSFIGPTKDKGGKVDPLKTRVQRSCASPIP